MLSDARFSLTIFSIALGAFLLFMVQPMASKFLLPVLGGGPSVWNTAMVFFQIALLGGYTLAHLSGRLPLRGQILLPLCLLLTGAVISLPMAAPLSALGMPDVSRPVLWQFSALLLMAGLPFLALSTLSPLLQRWFALAYPAREPYTLYRASNIGSLLGLLAYPFAAEPLLTLSEQSIFWAGLYGVLIVGLALLAHRLWHLPVAPVQAQTISKTNDLPSPKQYGLWLALAFLPSALLLGVTTYITTDIASLPLFWIVPLALYLITYILGFSPKLALLQPLVRGAQLVTLLLFIWLSVSQAHVGQWHLLGAHLALFFFNALACHQLLYLHRPASAHLTRFYLTTSLGGALGGVCVALIAPLVFPLPLEYPLAIALGALTLLVKIPGREYFIDKLPFKRLAVLAVLGGTILSLPDYPSVTRLFLASVSIGLLASLCLHRNLIAGLILVFMAAFPLYPWSVCGKSTLIVRSYFGVLRVFEDAEHGTRNLTNGTTLHGQQIPDEDAWKIPLSYYSTHSPYADAMRVLNARPDGGQHIAALGLGVGSVACYARPERHYTFFEIDPAVIAIAQDTRYFHYLSACGSPYDIKQGDARLMLQSEPDAQYDLILVDVFSSDSIPVHTMTTEAIGMYMRKLRPDGILLFHVSNRHFTLMPEIGRITAKLGYEAITRTSRDAPITENVRATSTNYVAVAHTAEVLQALEVENEDWHAVDEPGGRPWSDNYVNILRAMRKH